MAHKSPDQAIWSSSSHLYAVLDGSELQVFDKDRNLIREIAHLIACSWIHDDLIVAYSNGKCEIIYFDKLEIALSDSNPLCSTAICTGWVALITEVGPSAVVYVLERARVLSKPCATVVMEEPAWHVVWSHNERRLVVSGALDTWVWAVGQTGFQRVTQRAKRDSEAGLKWSQDDERLLSYGREPAGDRELLDKLVLDYSSDQNAEMVGPNRHPLFDAIDAQSWYVEVITVGDLSALHCPQSFHPLTTGVWGDDGRLIHVNERLSEDEYRTVAIDPVNCLVIGGDGS